jgi:hypothetical protein
MKKLQKLLIILVSSLISLAFPVAAAFADEAAPPSLSISFGSTEDTEVVEVVEVEEDDDAPPSLSISFDTTEEEEEIIVETPPSTLGTGPGVLIYAALPALGLFMRRK